MKKFFLRGFLTACLWLSFFSFKPDAFAAGPVLANTEIMSEDSTDEIVPVVVALELFAWVASLTTTEVVVAGGAAGIVTYVVTRPAPEITWNFPESPLEVLDAPPGSEGPKLNPPKMPGVSDLLIRLAVAGGVGYLAYTNQLSEADLKNLYQTDQKFKDEINNLQTRLNSDKPFEIVVKTDKGIRKVIFFPLISFKVIAFEVYFEDQKTWTRLTSSPEGLVPGPSAFDNELGQSRLQSYYESDKKEKAEKWQRGLEYIRETKDKFKNGDTSKLSLLLKFVNGSPVLYGVIDKVCKDLQEEVKETLHRFYCAEHTDQELLEDLRLNFSELAFSLQHISAAIRLCRQGDDLACEILDAIFEDVNYNFWVQTEVDLATNVAFSDITVSVGLKRALKTRGIDSLAQVFELGYCLFRRLRGIESCHLHEIISLLLKYGYDVEEWLGSDMPEGRVNELGYNIQEEVSPETYSWMRNQAVNLDNLWSEIRANPSLVPIQYLPEVERLFKKYKYPVDFFISRDLVMIVSNTNNPNLASPSDTAFVENDRYDNIPLLTRILADPSSLLDFGTLSWAKGALRSGFLSQSEKERLLNAICSVLPGDELCRGVIIETQADKKIDPNQGIEELALGIRVFNILRKKGITKLGQLMAVIEESQKSSGNWRLDLRLLGNSKIGTLGKKGIDNLLEVFEDDLLLSEWLDRVER